MAVTFAASNLKKNVMGNKRAHTARLTATGTTSDDGDALSARTLAMANLENVVLQPAIDSTTNPENVFGVRYNPTSGKIVFFTAHGTPGGAVAGIQVTDGTTVTNYVIEATAIGT